MNQLPDFQLEVYFSRWEFAARHVLTASDAQSMSLDELLALGTEADRAEFGRLGLGYAPTWGGDGLRQAVADTYETLRPEHVLACAGAEEGLYWLMQEAAGPGDHIVLTVPNYQSMESVALATGAQVSALTLEPQDGWALDLDRLERALRPTTKLVAVNFPNNPSGSVPDQATFRALAGLCEARGIRLFCDEVHRGLELDPARRLPQAADLSPTAVSLNVMSKSYGLAGLRVGWLASRDRALLERLERRKHYTSICNSGPGEFLTTLALRHGEAIQARNRAIIRANLPLFDAFFARWADLFEWAHPQGGCICFPRYKGPEGVETFCRELVEQSGVFLAPASLFRSALAETPTDRFRVGVGRSDPAPALAAFDRFLSGRRR
ncbi:MAG TPA: aminotransferase class I/II-fold pyridoxal phosphate-dependent enzyme [Holophaga sp.]|nr:aminotransferase class I/II-fold pyridoxal phosphate-dependent enzyme [Holophaga sp.]HPS68303.1 aminotransferase class I/II-fold pyridoxal phosphate-dependent enzyme [Holophaga sp.]